MISNLQTDYQSAVDFLRKDALSNPKVSELSPPLREASVFRRLLEQIPIGKIPGEKLAGDYGMYFSDSEFSAKVKSLNNTNPVQVDAMETPYSELQNRYHCWAGFSPAHSSADYPRILDKGLRGIINELRYTDSSDPDYIKAEIMTLEAVCSWSERYIGLGFEVCRSVPANPPDNFLEAVQAIWLVHTVIGIAEKSYASLSLGRLDQYLYRYYKADLERGVPESDLEDILVGFFLKLNRYGDAACAVNLGAVDKNGNDLFNDLSRLIVKIATRLQMPSPILAARIHPGINRKDFDSLTVPELFQIGQPSFYGEFSCQKALSMRGVPEADLPDWAVNSCMGLAMPGQEFSDMWAVVFTFMLPLELALNKGLPFQGTLPMELKTSIPDSYSNIDELISVIMQCAEELLSTLIKRHQQINDMEGRNNPDPYLSALLTGGEKGKDRLSGGPRYHTANVDAFALVNVADALVAVNQLVFVEHKFTLADIVTAVKNNFSDADNMRQQLLRAPKYGNGIDIADQMVARLADYFANIVQRHNTGSIIYMPSFHTLDVQVDAGMKWGAGADGRLAGEPFAKNIGPMQGRNIEGLTALLRSAGTIPQMFFCGGQALDLYVDSELISNNNNVEKFQAALQTYFKQGGLQVQVNSVNTERLEQALENPESYGDLIVRIGGYSARFVTLSRQSQIGMIKRFKHTDSKH